MIKDACGVVGLYSDRDVSSRLCNSLIALQHRGQESAGIAVFDETVKGKINLHKSMGLVPEVFNQTILKGLKGDVGIGHVRYSTAGESIPANSQPYLAKDPGFAIAMNGNIPNYQELKRTMSNSTFDTTSDLELVAHLLTAALKEKSDWFKAIEDTMEKLVGAYTLVILTEKGELIAVRGPLGIRPLCLGRIDETYVIASETSALDSLRARLIRDVEPGEVVLIDERGLQTRLLDLRPHAHCMFEWVYFARADSVVEGISVHAVRERLGRNLAREHPVDCDIVIPVPDSGRSAASGFAMESGKPLLEGFIKNRYLGRTFIMPHQNEREEHLKFNPIKTVVKGKRVVLVDDSIVRGTTLPKLVHLLKSAGSREVHVRISCPPIRSPCLYGIDFPTFEELIASEKSVSEIREKVKADSLVYQTVDGLIEAIGLPREELCLACLTGKYPTRFGDIGLEQLREICGRTGGKG